MRTHHASTLHRNKKVKGLKMAVKEIKTTITNQNINDVKKLFKLEVFSQDQKIKIAIAFGASLAKQNFAREDEYYIFLDKFKKYLSRLV